MKYIVTAFILFLLTACGATIQSYESFSKDAETEYTASIGKELYKIKREKDLPNAFGKADVFGGKVDASYTELRFAGLTSDGNIIFRLVDIEIESNETTMSRRGQDTSTITTTETPNPGANNPYYVGSKANTYNSTVQTFRKPEGGTTQLPPNTTEFIFNPKERLLKLDNVTVEITKVSSYSISYVLHR